MCAVSNVEEIKDGIAPYICLARHDFRLTNSVSAAYLK